MANDVSEVRHSSKEKRCIHAPLAVGQKPFNETVEMESFTIQVFVPTSAEFRKADSDYMRKFFIEQSSAVAGHAVESYLSERESVEPFPKEHGP